MPNLKKAYVQERYGNGFIRVASKVVCVEMKCHAVTFEPHTMEIGIMEVRISSQEFSHCLNAAVVIFADLREHGILHFGHDDFKADCWASNYYVSAC